MDSREKFQASVLRHGFIAELGKEIEAGRKPPYENMRQFMEGEIDPPIDVEATKRVIEERVENGELRAGDFNVIIHSPALRATQTAELIRETLGPDAQLRPSEYLAEVKISMDSISPEQYDAAPSLHEVRRKFMDDFLKGAKVDEGPVDVYRRAQRFLEFFRKTRTLTNAKPLYVSHGIFSRFLQLAIEHQNENLTDEQVMNLVQQEFHNTQRPDVLGGIRVENTHEGTSIVSM